MALVASRIEQYLDQRQIDYEVLQHESVTTLLQAAESLTIATEHIIRAVVLQADQRLVIAVLPLGRMLDFNALARATGTDFEPVSVASVSDIFPDCEAGMVPPLGSLYQLDTYCDTQVQQMRQVVFEAGSRRALIRVSGRDFAAMIGADGFIGLSRAQHELEHLQHDEASTSLGDFVPVHVISDSPDQLYPLPPAPPLLLELQQYSAAGMHDSGRLSRLIADEPQLVAQFKKMARSAFFVTDGGIAVDTEDEAIEVLGMDLSLALLQGLLVWDALQLPPEGPLGKTSLLEQASLAAQVTHRLIHASGGIADIDAINATQMALLHNVGYLVLSQLFAPEYFLFNRMVQANTDMPVAEIEKRLLAYGQAHTLMRKGHAEVGAWLLKAWGFAQDQYQVCEQHHNSAYTGPYQQYVHLLIVVNYLLKDSGLGDSGNSRLCENCLSVTGLTNKVLNDFQHEILEPLWARSPSVKTRIG